MADLMTREEIDAWLDQHYPQGCAEWYLPEMLESFQQAVKNQTLTNASQVQAEDAQIEQG